MGMLERVVVGIGVRRRRSVEEGSWKRARKVVLGCWKRL